MNDETLYELFISGKQEMLEPLVERYQKPLYSYLARYTNNASLAEEILQETFVKIFTKRSLYRPDTPFRPWLYKIAINTARDKLRQLKIQPTSLDNKDEIMAKALDSPVRELQAKELGEMIQNAVQKLPEAQRQVFILREYEKMSYAEISTTIERPINTVKSDMHRALKSLRNLLDSLTDIAMKGEYV